MSIYRGLSWCRVSDTMEPDHWKRDDWTPVESIEDRLWKRPTCHPIWANKLVRNDVRDWRTFRKAPNCQSTANSREKANPKVQAVIEATSCFGGVTIATQILAEQQSTARPPSPSQNGLPLSLQLDLPYFFLFYFLFSTESLKSNFSKFGQQQFQLFLDVVDLMTYRRRL